MHKAFQARRGFTLIELLLVIGIIAILASIVIVAINPTKQLGDARDSQRRSDVNTILSAVYQYAIDNQGNYPYDLQRVTAGAVYDICKCESGTNNCLSTGASVADSCGSEVTDGITRINLRELTGSYLLALPKDPRFASGASTEYTIQRLGSGRIEVCAPHAEQTDLDAAGNNTPICVTR